MFSCFPVRLHHAFEVAAQEQSRHFFKAVHRITDKVRSVAVGLAFVQAVAADEQGLQCPGCFAAGIDECHIRPHNVADNIAEQRIVGAAQNQGVHVGLLHALQIFPGYGFDDRVAHLKTPVFN